MDDKTILTFLRDHKWTIVCGCIGLVFALCVITYGFWRALFICLCIAAGIFLGKKLDEKWNISESLNQIFKK
ncbi:MAG: DUF2273 domain-containing protein [Firmicutes bacterium]|nr:DUF2273 domain-containing protein [Bacillota bacterium]